MINSWSGSQIAMVIILAIIGLYLLVRIVSFGIFKSWFQVRKLHIQELLKLNKKEDVWRKDQEK